MMIGDGRLTKAQTPRPRTQGLRMRMQSASCQTVQPCYSIPACPEEIHLDSKAQASRTACGANARRDKDKDNQISVKRAGAS
jgi:hypothetical protein